MKRSRCKVLAAIILALVSLLALAQEQEMKPTPQPRYVPKYGYVPNEATAVSIAEAVLIPIYGREKIESEKPFHAKLASGTWIVEGSLSQGMEGGVATVRLLKSDGRILSVIHGK